MADMLKTVIGDAASGEPRAFDPALAAKEHPEIPISALEIGLRELVQRWRELEESEAASIGESIVYGECADELESLLGRGG